MALLSFFFQKPSKTIQVNPLFKVSNMWSSNDYSSFWLYRFLQHHQLHQYSIHIFSVFGNKPILERGDINIFFTGENVHLNTYRKYRNNAVDIADISIGFDNIEADNYIRFPLWITYFFPPDATLETIQTILNNNNYSDNVIKRPTQFALIASHDKRAGNRRKITKFLEKEFKAIDCAGKLLNNTDILQTKFNDDKIAYLKNVAFNVCPENSNYKGYVTEKIFEAIQAGCIPIYWGSNNLPEPEILNHEAIVFFNANENAEKLIHQINSFYSQKNIQEISRFNKDAANIIWEMYNKLHELLITKIKAKAK